ncbi:MAG: hemolysin family protein [Gemmatimonadota bacterium]|nr:hemolysin family protein [Gemmatimonadota bacterium]
MDVEPAGLTAGSIAVRLGAVIILVLANAFFVAAEFSLVAVRRSRIEQMVAHGDRRARVVQVALRNLDRYISGTQLGITLASLALGWIGEPVVAAMIDNLFRAVGMPIPSGAAHSAAAIGIAFFIITFLHVVLGELAPKSLALVTPERVSKLVARPLILFSRLMSPFIWLLNGAANALLRLVGIRPVSELSHVHSAQELRLLVMQARAHGTLDESDTAMLAGVFDFHEKRARDVMRPRTEIVAIAADATTEQAWEILRRERYSRYPVYEETLDNVIGVFLAKDFWLYDGNEPFVLRKFVREALYLPETRPAERVLDDLRKTRAQMAVVVDEYGGTAGILTMEDLVEEVVGDINDEYDVTARREAVETNGVLELEGALSLVDARSDYELMIPDGDWSTLGGYAFAKVGRIPRLGDRAAFPGGELEVVAMDGRRVAAVRVHRRMSGNIEPERTRVTNERPAAGERRGRGPSAE